MSGKYVKYIIEMKSSELSKEGEDDKNSKANPEALIKKLKNSPEDTVVRFASGISGYYVKYSTNEQRFQVISAGPHGPESEKAFIDEHNISLLHREAEKIDYVSPKHSPFQ